MRRTLGVRYAGDRYWMLVLPVRRSGNTIGKAAPTGTDSKRTDDWQGIHDHTHMSRPQRTLDRSKRRQQVAPGRGIRCSDQYQLAHEAGNKVFKPLCAAHERWTAIKAIKMKPRPPPGFRKRCPRRQEVTASLVPKRMAGACAWARGHAEVPKPYGWRALWSILNGLTTVSH